MMAAPLLFSCSIPIHDEQFCSPIPGGLGAVCDNFLTSNQLILSQDQWNACTTSKTVGDIKAEIEELCSRVSCDDLTQTAILNGLNKIKKLGVQ